eukprot:5629272-Pyramimonas_sp.AAC.1
MQKTEARRHRPIVFPSPSPSAGRRRNGPGRPLDAGSSCTGRRVGGGQPGRRVAGEMPAPA